MQFLVVIGDYSGDGHMQTREYCLEAKVWDMDDVRDAYNKGVEALGFDICKMCDEYEDNLFPVTMTISSQSTCTLWSVAA